MTFAGVSSTRPSEDVDVAAAESEAGVAFPCIDEAVDAVELDRAECVHGEAEHAASADG
jgi:hypothetical protein